MLELKNVKRGPRTLAQMRADAALEKAERNQPKQCVRDEHGVLTVVDVEPEEPAA